MTISTCHPSSKTITGVGPAKCVVLILCAKYVVVWCNYIWVELLGGPVWSGMLLGVSEENYLACLCILNL